jgi:hypothetical protein
MKGEDKKMIRITKALTPAKSNKRREAIMIASSWYLSETYITSLTPLWIMSLAHSLQGKRATYMRQPEQKEERKKEIRVEVGMKNERRLVK